MNPSIVVRVLTRGGHIRSSLFFGVGLRDGKSVPLPAREKAMDHARRLRQAGARVWIEGVGARSFVR